MTPICNQKIPYSKITRILKINKINNKFFSKTHKIFMVDSCRGEGANWGSTLKKIENKTHDLGWLRIKVQEQVFVVDFVREFCRRNS